MKLSIIVPVYKVEPYLRKCVDSLLAQDLPNDRYEIILVDDGSPDKCPEICDQYAAVYKNISVIHRPNGGLSAARNSGIKVARGEYVQFVDSDDYLESNVLMGLLNIMEEDELDVLRFNYQNVNEHYEVFNPNKTSKPFVDFKDDVCDGLTFLTERLGFACYVWQFMIHRELLDGCWFEEGLFFEDTDWTPRVLHKAKRVNSTCQNVYFYVMRKGSITRSIDEEKKLKLMNDRLQLIDLLQKQKLLVSDERWFDGMIAQISLAIISTLGKDFFYLRRDYIHRLQLKGVFPLSHYHASRSSLRKILIVNISPLFLCLLLHLKNK